MIKSTVQSFKGITFGRRMGTGTRQLFKESVILDNSRKIIFNLVKAQKLRTHFSITKTNFGYISRDRLCPIIPRGEMRWYFEIRPRSCIFFLQQHN